MAEIRTYIKTGGRQARPELKPVDAGRVRLDWRGTSDDKLLVSAILTNAERDALADTLSGGGSSPSEPVPTPPPSDPSVLWFDGFDEPPGTPFNGLDWFNVPTNEVYAKDCPVLASNAFHDGNGNLVLRVKREPSGVVSPRDGLRKPFSGAMLGTYQHGTGWPPTSVKRSWEPPFALEWRWKLPNLPGAYCLPWLMGVNRDTEGADVNHEIDCAELTPTNSTTWRAYQHKWDHVSGRYTDLRNTSIGSRTVTDIRTNWHVGRVEVRQEGVRYMVDGTQFGLVGPVLDGPGAPIRFGLLINNVLAPNSWYGGNSPGPPSTDAGPWDVLVDYVKVTRL